MTTETLASDIAADDEHSVAVPHDAPATEHLVATTSLDVVIPVYNEQNDLAQAVRRLHTYLQTSLPYSFQITIANNASTDGTAAIADEMADHYDEVRVLHLEQKGRGRALKAAWGSSASAVLAYMDVDLSTDLAALLPLIAPLLTGHSDLAIGRPPAPRP